jgi:hypothetical protein
LELRRVVAATIIVVAALAAVSEIVLPLTFAVVLAVIFQPAVEILVHHRFKPTIAAGLVVVGLLALMAGVVVANRPGRDRASGSDRRRGRRGAAQSVDALGVDRASLVDAARAAVEKASPAISGGFLTNLVSGIDTLIGPRQRPDTRRPDHVLPAQGRNTLPAHHRRLRISAQSSTQSTPFTPWLG